MPTTLTSTGVQFPDGTVQTTRAVSGGTGTVTSITAGAGLAGGTITGSGTISLSVYTGTTINYSTWAVGTYLFLYSSSASNFTGNPNTTCIPAIGTSNPSLLSTSTSAVMGGTVTTMAGTWMRRGINPSSPCMLVQRSA